DSDRCSDSGSDHVDAGSDGKQPRVSKRRDLYRAVHFLDELLPTDRAVLRPDPAKRWLEKLRTPLGVPAITVNLTPVLFGFENDGGFNHAHRRWISRSFRFADLSKHTLNFRKLRQELVLNLEILGRLSNRDTGQRDRHIEDRAFVKRRHEFGAKPQIDRDR